MSTTFHVNERAILLPPRTGAVSLIAASYVGTRVTVISELTPLSELTTLNVKEKHGYLVALFDGHIGWVVPYLLQKIPPQDPTFAKWRDQLVREHAMDAEPPVLNPRHPSIVSMLEFIGQGSP